MAKKTSLAAAIKKPSSSEPKPVSDDQTVREQIAFRITPEAKKQLKILAAENGSNIQDTLVEALNDVFTKYGKPGIA